LFISFFYYKRYEKMCITTFYNSIFVKSYVEIDQLANEFVLLIYLSNVCM